MLKQDKYMNSPQVDNTISVKMALINARSVVNKTFILNDYCSSNNLDFLFVTETWLDALDLSPLSELCPFNYLFLNSPRTSGRGGGIATVYKKSF